MNLFSAFNGALTIVLAERLLRRWRTSLSITFGALGLLAVAPFFWALSLIAEVYTLHTALMVSLILVLLRWGDDPRPRNLALVGLIAGLGLANHAATVLLAPGITWYLLSTHRRPLQERSLILPLGGLLLGLSFYLYIPIRFSAAPAFNYAGYYDARGIFHPINMQSLEGVWQIVSGRDFAGSMFAYRGGALWGEVVRFGADLWRAFAGIGITPGLIGLVVLLRRDWRLGGALLLMFASHAAFFISYRAVDKELMFLPTYLIWSLWVGTGYQWLLGWVAGGLKPSSGLRAASVLFNTIIVGAVLLAGFQNWRLNDLSDDRSARTMGEEILDLAKPDALIFGYWDVIPVIEYLQFVEGLRPDVVAINRFLISPPNMTRLILQEIEHLPVYIDSPVDTLPSDKVRYQEAGAIYLLSVPP